MRPAAARSDAPVHDDHRVGANRALREQFAGHFYDGLRTLGAAEALAAAQRRMLADARYQAPYFWASCQMSGDGTSGNQAAGN